MRVEPVPRRRAPIAGFQLESVTFIDMSSYLAASWVAAVNSAFIPDC